MTNSTDKPNEDFPIPEIARRDALLEMVAKYEVYKEHYNKVEAARENRQTAEDEFDTARVIAENVCEKTDYIGTMVRGTMIISIFKQGISIENGEILE